MDLNDSKFGDKFMTRDGRIAVVINEHKNARKHWYDFMALEDGVEMLGNEPYKFSAYDNGIAFEGFEWLDIILKLEKDV